MDLTHVPGLISLGERKLMTKLSSQVEIEFGVPTIVNLGVYLGASCYCCRAGSPKAKLIGVDVWPSERIEDTPEMRAVLNMRHIQGDTRTIHTEFDEPIHFIFIDACHEYTYVKPDILNWALPYVVKGGIAAFHDAHYEEGAAFAYSCRGVKQAIEELIVGKGWEELDRVDTTRVFRRL